MLEPNLVWGTSDKSLDLFNGDLGLAFGGVSQPLYSPLTSTKATGHPSYLALFPPVVKDKGWTLQRSLVFGFCYFFYKESRRLPIDIPPYLHAPTHTSTHRNTHVLVQTCVFFSDSFHINSWCLNFIPLFAMVFFIIMSYWLVVLIRPLTFVCFPFLPHWERWPDQDRRIIILNKTQKHHYKIGLKLC